MNAPFSHHAILAALREENDILRETVRQLREELAPAREFPVAWRLSPQQAAFLSCVMATAPGIARQSRILSALYEDRDPPDSVINLITVLVYRLRRPTPRRFKGAAHRCATSPLSRQDLRPVEVFRLSGFKRGNGIASHQS